MWCPDCNISFDSDEKTCPRCGRTLIAVISGSKAKAQWGLSSRSNGLKKNWPVDISGEPERACFLTHRSSVNFDDKLLVNMLAAYGIPALISHPQDGCFGKVVLGISGDGSDVYVPISMLENAKALMEDIQND